MTKRRITELDRQALRAVADGKVICEWSAKFRAPAAMGAARIVARTLHRLAQKGLIESELFPVPMPARPNSTLIRVRPRLTKSGEDAMGGNGR